MARDRKGHSPPCDTPGHQRAVFVGSRQLQIPVRGNRETLDNAAAAPRCWKAPVASGDARRPAGCPAPRSRTPPRCSRTPVATAARYRTRGGRKDASPYRLKGAHSHRRRRASVLCSLKALRQARPHSASRRCRATGMPWETAHVIWSPHERHHSHAGLPALPAPAPIAELAQKLRRAVRTDR